jgi:hypothetical protein
METILLVIPVLVTLVVGAILFLIREKRFAPWIWVPASAWGLGRCLKLLLGVFMMRNTRPEPKEGLWLGFDPLALYAVLCAGLVGLVVWLGFPRKTTWRDKSWAGGVLVLIGVPLLMGGLKVLFGAGAGSGSGSIWLIALLAAGVPALFVAVLLFLLRKRSVAPWIWMPVTAWSAWGGLSLLPTVMPRDPKFGPAEWNLFGLDALLVLCVLFFTGAVVVGALICFPRRLTWRAKSWLGGLMVAAAVPLAGWLLFTNPFSLQLIGPDGKPVTGATIYRFHRGLGGRLPAVTEKTSDAEGIVIYRVFHWTDLSLVVPQSASWVTTEISFRSPEEGGGDLNPVNFNKKVSLSWGNGLSTDFNHAFHGKPSSGWRLPDREASGHAGWVVRDAVAKELIPIYLHSGVRPIFTGLLELLRTQLRDLTLVAQFPFVAQEIASSSYGVFLGQEFRDLHTWTLNTNAPIEWRVREALFTQAGVLAGWMDNIDRIQRAGGPPREAVPDDIRPWIGSAGTGPAGLDSEQKQRLIRDRVNEEAGMLLEHIRLHPGTTGRSLRDFEQLLAEPNPG